MIDGIEITNFRGIAHGKITGLTQLCAIVGANNSGKSTILEALYVVAKRGNLETWSWAARRRGWLGRESVTSFCNKGAAHFNIAELDQRSDEKRTFALEVDVPETESFLRLQRRAEPVCFVKCESSVKRAESGSNIFYTKQCAETAEVATDGSFHLVDSKCTRETAAAAARFSDTINPPLIGTLEDAYSDAAGRGAETKEVLLGLVRKLRPGLKNLEILKRNDKAILFVMEANSSSPFAVVGDGTKRLFLIACDMAISRGGLCLIEEPESYQHPGAMDEFARLVWEAVAQGTQIVFSTHSLEILERVFKTEKGRDLTKASVIRTRLSNGELTTQSIPGPNASERLIEVGEDLRQ
jgi:predicted ATPase